MTDLILWRHGQTDYNLQGRIQGRVDIPLNGTGREQARRAADIIAVLKPTRIVSSPLVRARATAETLASLIGQSVEVDSALAVPVSIQLSASPHASDVRTGLWRSW